MALAESEIAGARVAVDEINHSGGILGRETQLLAADSENDIVTGVDKSRKLIDRGTLGVIFS